MQILDMFNVPCPIVFCSIDRWKYNHFNFFHCVPNCCRMNPSVRTRTCLLMHIKEDLSAERKMRNSLTIRVLPNSHFPELQSQQLPVC